MREKWSAMPFYRQAMLAATVGLMVLFAVLYLIMGRQNGLEYGNDFYKLKAQGDARVYTGVDHGQRDFISTQSGEGKKTVYTVCKTPDGYRVECQIEGQEFGPYQVTEFPRSDVPAVLTDLPLEGGLEIKNTATGELLFRGGYWQNSGYVFLVNENAKTEADGNAALTDKLTVGSVSLFDYAPPIPEEGPSCDDLVRFTLGAEANMTHKGDWMYYALALLAAVFNAASLLYAEELFIFHMSFRVAEPERVEPSEWELFTRHVGWGVLLLLELILLFTGLFSIV